MQKISPFLWFNDNAEEAAKFYVDVFNGNPEKTKKSKIGVIARYDEAGSKVSNKPEGSVMTISFNLEGNEFTAINGGPNFTFSGAISFVIDCKNQEEVDYFWDKLSEGGESGVCGWINRDKFGITWQIVPRALPKMLNDKNIKKSKRAMEAMLKMEKINISELKKAFEGKKDI